MSTHKVIEQTPRRFTRRQGDWAQEGGNNTLIVMGTDRAAPGPASVDAGLGTIESEGGGKGAGSILAVAGRHDPSGDPDFTSDDAFVYLSQRTRADKNLLSSGIGKETDAQPAIVAKSTDIRVAFGGPDLKGNLKVFLDDEDKRRFIYVDSEMTQVSVAADTAVTLREDTVEARVGQNTITISRDGSVVIKTESRVTIQTQEVTVDAQKSTFKGDVFIDKTLNVTGMSNLNGNTTTPVANIGSIATGPRPGPSSMQGPLTVTGDVSGAGKSLSGHTHPVAAVKAGTDSVTTQPPS